MYNKLKEKFSKYFFRMFLFFVIFHVLIRPAQSALNQKIIAPIIIEKLDAMGPHFSLHTKNNHTLIRSSISEKYKKTVLSFSIPFGQFYFFLIFFLWFKPLPLVRALSIYNFMLIPAYAIAIFMFLIGYEIFGFIIIMNEKLFRLIYFFIFSLKIFRPKQFKVIFSN